VRTHGIRTVVNLRGCCDPLPWYHDECRTTNRLNVAQEDLSFSAGRYPPVHEIRHLIEVLDRSERPLLLHCYRGIDRTGLVSTVAQLLYTDTSLAKARRQLGLRFCHLRWGKTGYLDRFFDLYEEWLSHQVLEHTPGHFRRWALHEYCPAECRCSLE